MLHPRPQGFHSHKALRSHLAEALGQTYSYLEQLSIKNLHPYHTSSAASRKSSPDLVKYYGVTRRKCLSHRLPVLMP